jgi:phosphoserine phosphatase
VIQRTVVVAGLGILLLACVFSACTSSEPTDPLPSWKDGEVRTAITRFVEAVTDEGGPAYVPPVERIAVFDNDGTLWAEKPVYFQLYFALDRVRALAPQHPEWATTQPFQAALEGDLESILAGGESALLELVMATHAGMTTDEFDQTVREWISTATHPTTGRRYTEMVYQPMLELLTYLRASGFRTFIVSGGGIDFLRVWAEEVYGVPPHQVVGSSIRTVYEMREDGPALVRLPEIDFIDDKAGKPLAIHRHIAARPIAAFGNSDGDLQMLQWTCAGDGERLCLYVHHTDADREWAYGRESAVGRLDRGLDEAAEQGWAVVDMANDWASVFAP